MGLIIPQLTLANNSSTPLINMVGLPTASSLTNVLVYNSASGELSYTSSAAVGGGPSPTPTGSLLTTASVSSNVITFTKGDGSTFPITVATGSGGGSPTPTGSLLITASATLNVITFTKGDGSTFPITINTGSGGGGTAFPYTGSAVITGSLVVTGSTTSTLGFTGSLLGTATTASYINLVAGPRIEAINYSGSIISITGSIGGSNTQVQYNAGGAFAGTASFTFIYQSQSLQQGQSVIASGLYSHAQGDNTTATGDYSHAEGNGYAYGFRSHAEGDSTQAYGEASHVEGQSTTTIGQGSHAEGRDTIASGSYSHAEGTGTIAIGDYSHAEGYYSQTGTTQAYYAIRNEFKSGFELDTYYGDVSSLFASGLLFLDDTIYDNVYGKAIFEIVSSNFNGTKTEIILGFTINTSIAIIGNLSIGIDTWTGDQTISGLYSHTEGDTTYTLGNYSHAEGKGTIALGVNQHIQGQYNIPNLSSASFIIGNGVDNATRSNLIFAANSEFQISGSLLVSGALESGGTGHIITYNTASGLFTYTASSAVATGISTPGGLNTQIQFNSGSSFSGNSTFIFNYISESLQQGLYTTASGQYSHAEGWLTIASGDYSHAEGYQPIATGNHSHAEGRATLSSGEGSHAEGIGTIASGQYSHAEGAGRALGVASHAEGINTTASGSYSHAEGSNTIALGGASHAEGSNTIALGVASHAEGDSTIAAGSYQTVVGSYNVQNNTGSKFTVGIGNSTTRKDGFTVDVDANLSGSVMIPTNTANPSSPKAGTMYYNTSQNSLYVYNGIVWRSASFL